MKRRTLLCAAAASLLTAIGCSTHSAGAEGVIRWHIGPDGSLQPVVVPTDPGQPPVLFELDTGDTL